MPTRAAPDEPGPPAPAVTAGEEARRPTLKLPLLIMLVPIPFGVAVFALSALFERARPPGEQDLSRAFDFVLPLTAVAMIGLVCTIVALPLTLRAPPSPRRRLLLLLELAVLAFAGGVGWFLFR